MKYSYSALNEYKNCPFKFKLKRIDELTEPPSEALLLGDYIHNQISEYLNVCIQNKYKTYLDFLNKFSPPEHLEEADQIMENFVSNYVINWDLVSDMHSEKQLAFTKDWQETDWKADDVYFRMKIDEHHQENDLLVVTDFKTDRSISFTQDFFQQKPLLQIPQLAIYAYGAHLLYPECERFVIRFHYVRYNVIRWREITLEELETVPDYINESAETIESDETYDPRISSFCDYCGFTSKCPAMQKALEDSGDSLLETEEDANTIAESMRAMETMIKKYKKKLRSFVDKNGSLLIGNERLDFHVRETASFPLSKVMDVIASDEENVELINDIKLSKTAISNILKKIGRQDIWPSLEDIKEVSNSTSFGWKKK